MNPQKTSQPGQQAQCGQHMLPGRMADMRQPARAAYAGVSQACANQQLPGAGVGRIKGGGGIALHHEEIDGERQGEQPGNQPGDRQAQPPRQIQQHRPENIKLLFNR